MAQIHRSLARLEGIDLLVRDTRTAGPPILCLHGRWGRGETWVDFMRHYGDRYRVVAPDLRGHGLSGKPVARYSAAEMALDMVRLINYLQLEPVIVMGHSMGGHVAGYMAASYPNYVRAAAILDKSANGPDNPYPPPPEDIAPVDPLTRDWPMPFKSLLEAQEFIKQEMESEFAYDYFMNSLVETVEGYRMMFSAQAIAGNIAHYENWFELLPRIKCPVLLIRAKYNDAVSDEDFLKMQKMLGDCLAFDMPQADHNVYLADKAAFYRCFDEFLRKHG